MNFAAKDSWDKCHRKIFTFELYSKKQQTEHKHKASVHPTTFQKTEVRQTDCIQTK